MGILDKLFRKKRESEEIKKETSKNETETSISLLEEICRDDPETYEALYDVMFLDPTRIETTLKEAASKAKELEKSGEASRAAFYYQIAGGLALYEGDVSKVKEYFSKCEELTKKKFKILKNPEKAVEKAQEYYKRYLKKQ